MRVGFSYWGFCEPHRKSGVVETPDGLRMCRPILVNALMESGHDVVALQENREQEYYQYSGKKWLGDVNEKKGLHQGANPYMSYRLDLPDLDVVFLEWRWPTYKNSGPNPKESDWQRQCEILDTYLGRGTPVIAYDTDHQIRPEDEARWPGMIIADPALDPIHLHKKRTSLPYWSDFEPFFDQPSVPHVPIYGYLGNRYDRDEAFTKYYGEPSFDLRANGILTGAWGTWLQRSPERSNPQLMVTMWPSISFGGRVSFWNGMELLRNFVTTTHISRKSYYERGVVTMRVFEAIMCGVPALIPVEFKHLHPMASSHGPAKKILVENSGDVFRAVMRMEFLNQGERANIVAEQEDALCSIADFGVGKVVQFIESVVR